MPRFLLIPDKFKGSLSASDVIQSIADAIKATVADSQIVSVFASDGGDGFLQSVSEYIPIECIDIKTVDPLGRPLVSPVGFDSAGKTAYIELAKASGIVLLNEDEKNPMLTSTYGTGLQIREAIRLGANKIYLGIGGSATNDGGIGIANALGYKFFDENDCELAPIGKNLTKIKSIESNFKYHAISFYAINDVRNPLYGKNGAAYVYAKQKGASVEEIEVLDSGLQNLDTIVQKEFGLQNAHISGSGSAGGTGFGLKTFCNASYIGGIEFLVQLAQVDSLLQKGTIDYIVTGEGTIDSQTLYGKLISGVLKVANTYKIPVIGVCGVKRLTKTEEEKLGLQAIIEIADKNNSLEYNMNNAAELLTSKLADFLKNTI